MILRRNLFGWRFVFIGRGLCTAATRGNYLTTLHLRQIAEVLFQIQLPLESLQIDDQIPQVLVTIFRFFTERLTNNALQLRGSLWCIPEQGCWFLLNYRNDYFIRGRAFKR